MTSAKELAVVRARSALGHGRRTVLCPLLRGSGVECPCCGSTFRRFASYHGCPNALCPRCGSFSRHRLIWWFLDRNPRDLALAGNVLHIAPEPALARRLSGRPEIHYRTADLMSPSVDDHVDVTDLPYGDASFDVIICNHVLEHIPDDAGAMRELARVLRPGGWALLLVPVDFRRASTYEDSSIVTPAGRLAAFGQRDHVRIYGRDYPDRLRAAGFAVELLLAPAFMTPQEILRCAVDPEEPIFLAKRPPAALEEAGR